MKITRRDLLRHTATAVGASALPAIVQAQDEEGPTQLHGVQVEPFADPLPVPRTLNPSSEKNGADYYRIAITEFKQKSHRDLPPTTVWGYSGASPGPTIKATQNRAVKIDWINQLPRTHRLAIDRNICGAEAGVPEVRTVVHLHGGHVSAENDGYPDQWVVPGRFQKTIYPNRQPAATLWYHDHTMGITRLNAMMGLAGFYLIADAAEKALALPTGEFDVPLSIQDRIIDTKGQIAYPVGPNADSPWIPEFFGTQNLVNGVISPYLEVEPRLYRFRFLNSSNARVYSLSMTPGQMFFQIGSDGGLLCETIPRKQLLMAPAERLDVLVDFRGREGRSITIFNDAPAPFPSGSGPIPRLVMQFRVKFSRSSTTTEKIPTKLVSVPTIPESKSIKTRTLVLQEHMTDDGQSHGMLLDGHKFMDPVTEDPINGTTEIWELVNTTVDAHPIHLHAVHFQILDRRGFVTRKQDGKNHIVVSSSGMKPKNDERGWKDTVICPPGLATRIIVPFRGEPGLYVWHCHTLEHEDNEMMRPYVLRPSKA